MLGRDIQERLAKRYSSEAIQGRVKRAFGETLLEKFLEGSAPDREAYSALTFIDIAGFSSHVLGWSARDVRDFLDTYYDVAIPAIYESGGLIDRIAGDGILAAYSDALNPDLSPESCNQAALSASELVVSKLSGSDWSSKAAIALGDLLYCKTGVADVYEDFTVVGPAITEAYRIEDVAQEDQVVLRADSAFGRSVLEEARAGRTARAAMILRGESLPPLRWSVEETSRELRGVGHVPLLIQSFQG